MEVEQSQTGSVRVNVGGGLSASPSVDVLMQIAFATWKLKGEKGEKTSLKQLKALFLITFHHFSSLLRSQQHAFQLGPGRGPTAREASSLTRQSGELRDAGVCLCILRQRFLGQAKACLLSKKIPKSMKIRQDSRML